MMELFLIAWFVLGFAYWIKHQILSGSNMGIIGDVLLALPMCLLFGLIPFIHEWFE